MIELMNESRNEIDEGLKCGKDNRKYLYIMAALAIMILSATYIYEFHYLPARQAAAQGITPVNGLMNAPANGANIAAMAQPSTANQMPFMAQNGVGNSWPQGANVAAQPGTPPVIAANAVPPASHRQDGRAQMVCSSCHLVQGGGTQGQGNNVAAVMQPIDQNRPANPNPQGNMALQQPQLPPTQPMMPQGVQQGNRVEIEGQIPFAQIVRRVRPGIVNINSVRTHSPSQVQQDGGTARFANPFSGTSVESVGSGVMVSIDGFIVTNYHVIKDSAGIAVTVFSDTGTQRYSAEIVKIDERRDMALLKIRPDTLMKPIPLGDSSRVDIADSVLAIGSPYGLDQTVSRGIISGLRKSVMIENVTHEQLLQTDAAINQGNSGGALINRDGELIGINTAIYTPNGAFSGIGFAIPVNKVKEFIAEHVPPEMQARGGGRQQQQVVAWQGGGATLGQTIAAVAAPPIRANATPPGSHSDGRNQMACTTCHQIVGGANPPQANGVAWPGAMGGAMGQNVAAQQGPPITADAPIPGNHRRDGRDKVDCAVCHQINGTGRWKPVAWPGAMGGAMGQNVAAQQGPPITADAPIPGNHRRDGRDKVDCAVCHQINGTGRWKPAAFTQAQGGAVPFPLPMVVANTVAAQIYFDGAVLEPLTPVIIQRINAQVEDGAFVTTVYPDTAAARAGLHAGDIIFKLNGRWVLSPDELMASTATYQVGDNLRLGVYSGGQRRNLYLVYSGQLQQPSRGATATLAQQQTGAGNEMRWLGMELKPVTDALIVKNPQLMGKQGAWISDVDRNSVAEANGLQKGDLLKRINGQPVTDMATLESAINGADISQGVLLLLERNGRNLYLTLQ
ncbi:PDZ domain-containing protein [Ectothiorhodospiraceae bacterium BW-2]|nr:PDZ domain-containing protein [Ectothiorhodospiraceae bacterium BW-2]